MSINHFSPDFPETLWWTHHHQQSLMEQSSLPVSNTTQFPNHNKRLFIPQFYDHHHVGVLIDTEPSDFLQREVSSPSSLEIRESMFQKHLTPSDVGKLNRLVIPKHHAEKYFPLNNNNNNNGGDSGGGEKGLLLSFEDESGKCWRFRYSYWNSSQSYVLTKGWSRYVKEKRLDAGDVVLFERHRVELNRFFIGWRRRTAMVQDSVPSCGGGEGGGNSSNNSSGGEWSRVLYPTHPYPTHPLPLPDRLHAAAGSMEQNKTTPVANSKMLRLFGVNMECQLDDQSSEPQTPDGSSLSSSQGQAHHLYFPESHNNYMDINFSQDVNQMINHQG